MRFAVLAYADFLRDIIGLLVQNTSEKWQTVVTKKEDWQIPQEAGRILEAWAHLQAVDKHGYEYLVAPQFDRMGQITNALLVESWQFPRVGDRLTELATENRLPCAVAEEIVTGYSEAATWLGGCLRSLRKSLRMSAKELARRTGLSVDAIREIEGGHNQNLQPSQLRRIAEATKIDYRDLAQIAGFVSVNDPALGERSLGIAACRRGGAATPEEERLLAELLTTLRQRK